MLRMASLPRHGGRVPFCAAARLKYSSAWIIELSSDRFGIDVLRLLNCRASLNCKKYIVKLVKFFVFIQGILFWQSYCL